MAGYASVAVALTIIMIKLYAFFVTDSLSLLSSLVDSILDIVASVINMLAIRYALMPADDDHRFGHGKVEGIAALAQSTFIAGSALFILMEAGHRFIHPVVTSEPMVGVWVMVVSTVLTVLLLVFQRYVVAQTSSQIIEADSLHYMAVYW